MNTKTAVFAGGCFWCTEAVFKMLRGVIRVTPGYTGGKTAHPTYEDVVGGTTGHAEAIEVVYDPDLISYHDLLTVFFASHDPTTVNRQGSDIGTQYRSAIFYTDEEQKEEAHEIIKEIDGLAPHAPPVVTEVVAFTHFYPAEEYHLDYYARNRQKHYCELVINPKLEKIQHEFVQLIKRSHSL
jgi:peptide-methionine (S)-S-oxide reductase